MKDTYYFSHDYNARSDVKIKRLIAKHGLLGYGIYWAIIEDLYQNANALPLDCESIAFDLRTNEQTVTSIINDFDLFIIEGSEFGSLSVERRLQERAEKSKKAQKSAFLRWGKNANALRTQSDSNAIKERKEKERENKDNNTPPNFQNEDLNQNLNELNLENHLYDNPVPKEFEVTNEKKQRLYELKRSMLDLWIMAKKIKPEYEPSQIEFVRTLNQILFKNPKEFQNFAIGFRYYILANEENEYKFVSGLEKLEQKVKEKDWKQIFNETIKNEPKEKQYKQF